MDNNFISENGIVAVLGDEDQLVKGDARRNRNPLSNERGHMDQYRGNDASLRGACPGVSPLNIDPTLN